ncbi:Polyferredoxin NapH (periplasmic nitrate reductase) [hydrothermal vent metagenome]|uniref:Polyferredoxin NapH (Periplasmic nitrate reductase) n=1 Tax=hydrothermal vent metagenome TaxID=652676 RepID=A0A3B0YLZ1_9ZZZZ
MMAQRLQKKLNKLRWWILSGVFLMLIAIPWIHLYQTYRAAHVYDRLAVTEKIVYIVVDQTVKIITVLRKPFFEKAAPDLDAFKGSTWTGKVFGIKLSDPLATVGQAAASKSLVWTFLVTASIPIVLTIFFGRFFCGWLCPATLLYELNDNIASWLGKRRFPVARAKLNRHIKYGVLFLGLIISAAYGGIIFSLFYPPLLIGREINYVIIFGSFSAGMIFIFITLLFDMFVTRRGFCRVVCPGGALYSLLGKFRILRIQRNVNSCNDCAKCNAVCQFGLDPMHDNFGMECNNCSACIQVCPEDSLLFSIRITDVAYQGAGMKSKEAEKIVTGA